MGEILLEERPVAASPRYLKQDPHLCNSDPDPCFLENPDPDLEPGLNNKIIRFSVGKSFKQIITNVNILFFRPSWRTFKHQVKPPNL